MFATRQKTVRILGVLAITLTSFVVAIGTAAPASAKPVQPNSCVTDEDYVANNPALGWNSSNTSSIWAAGPSTITYTESKTATTTLGGSLSGGVGYTGSLVIISMETSIGGSVDLSTSSSRESSWSYDIPVPAGKTARAVVSERGYRASVTKYATNPDCSVTATSGSFHAGYASWTSSATCIYRDIWPATTFEATTGGCFSEN